MHSIQFWKSWSNDNRRLFWIFGTFALVAFLFLWVSELQSPSQVIEPVPARKIIRTPFDSHEFRLGAFDLQVPSDALIVFESNVGSVLTPNTMGSIVFLTMMMAGLIGILTIITTLPRFWFYTGIGFFLVIFLTLRIESLSLFGITNLFPPIAILILFLVVVFYFGLIKTDVPFTKRIIAFTGLTSLAALLINFSSQEKHPFLFLSANAMIPATIITLVFIFMVAHEPLAALLTAISRGVRQTKSLLHFLLIGSVYLINLGIIYANRKFIIQWNYLPINLMVFVSVSGILGLWGFRQRDWQFSDIIKANPFGVLFYLSMATIGFGTMGYFFATANDPVIRLSEDLILYSSLGYGIIFMIYAINNFGPMLAKNLQVYKIIYQPEHMPYFTFRLAGLICTFIFFFYSNYKLSLHQGYAGYYNAWGDNYLSEDTLHLAESQYNKASFFAERNYHAHYALAQIFKAQEETDKEIKEYKFLVNTRPIDYAYLNLNQLVHDKYSLSGSGEILRLGLHDFPKNGLLENELGLWFIETNQKDSAAIMIRSAMKISSSKKAASVNFIGLQAQFRTGLRADSLLHVSSVDNEEVKTNALALACVQGFSLTMNARLGKDTIMSTYQATSLHNQLINQNNPQDTALTSYAVSMAHKSNNPYLKDFLLSGAAYAFYTQGQAGKAIRTLREAAYANQQDTYYNALGLWSLEQNEPMHATEYFDKALRQNFGPALFNRAIGLTESQRIPEAIIAWDSVSKTSDIVQRSQGNKMIKILQSTVPRLSEWKDDEKYLYSRYKIELSNTSAFEDVVNAMTDPEWKAKALLDRSKQLDENGDPELAYAVLDAVKGLPLHDKKLHEEIFYQNVLYLAQQQKYDDIEPSLKDKSLFAGQYHIIRIYLDAMMNEKADNKKVATQEYSWLLCANPFFEDGIIAAIQYLGKDTIKSLTLYSALVSALDYNPNSMKLLQLYAIMSFRLDFDDAAQSSMERLKKTMSNEAFINFLKKYPDLFEVNGH